jgi:hypothetical protein
MRSIKSVIGTLASVAMLTFGLQASACVLNECNPNYGDGRTVTGQIWGSGGYIGQATGQNHTSGSILDRASVAETGGFSKLEGQTVTNTCNGGNCSSYSIMSGEGNVIGRSYEFVSGTGAGSSSAAQGGSALEIGVRSSIFESRTPVYTGHTQ